MMICHFQLLYYTFGYLMDTNYKKNFIKLKLITKSTAHQSGAESIQALNLDEPSHKSLIADLSHQGGLAVSLISQLLWSLS